VNRVTTFTSKTTCKHLNYYKILIVINVRVELQDIPSVFTFIILKYKDYNCYKQCIFWISLDSKIQDYCSSLLFSKIVTTRSLGL